MSLSHSPSIIINGLAMYYDMNNTQKSWKGAPTTNLVVTVPYILTNYAYCTGPVTVTTNNAIGQQQTVNRYTITSASGLTPRARIVATGLTTGINYSYSVKIRYNGGVYAQSWYIDSSKGNPEGSGNNTFNSHTASSTYLGNGWYQLTETFNFATCPTGGAWSNFGLVASNDTYLTQTFDAYDIQFEQNTYVTPFVNGTRSGTQAILDLTNNNTITPTSLTYVSDGTFSFDGNSNYLQGTSNCKITGSVTLSAIIKPSYFGQTGPHSTIICTDINYPYGAKLMNYKNIARYGLWLGFSGVDNYEAFVNVDINDNTTKMLTASWDQSTGIVNIYLNGELQSSQSTSKTIPTVLSDGKITLGTDYNSITSANKNKFLGNIYCASIYNRALSAAEVQQNFNALRGRYGI